MSATQLAAVLINVFVSVIFSVVITDMTLLILFVATLTFFLSMYRKFGGILSGLFLMLLITSFSNSFSSSSNPAICALWRRLSSFGNDMRLLVSCVSASYCSSCEVR